MLKFFQVFRDADNGGGGGGGGAGGTVSAVLSPGLAPIAPAAGDPPPAPAPVAGEPPVPPAWKMPEGLWDSLKADSPDKFTELATAELKRQREVISKIPAAPKSIEEYQFTPSDKLKGVVGDLANDPVFAVAKDAALAAGVPASAFGTFIGGLYETLADKGILPKAYDGEAERRAFLGTAAEGLTDAQTLEKVKPIIEEADLFIQSLANKGEIDKDVAQVLTGLLDDAPGLKAIAFLKAKLSTPGLQPGGGNAPAGGITHADLKARNADPRADRDSAKFDPKFVEETQRLYQQLFK